MEHESAYHSGFCCVIGRPNVGKSTLLNALIGQKISIISNKPQTTRHQIHLIYTDDRMQIVFLDTPGIQMPRNELGEVMFKMSRSALDGVDCALFVVDSSERIGRLDQKILEELDRVKSTPVIAVINKIDEISADEAAALVAKFESMARFASVVPISAREKRNLEELLQRLYNHLPEGPQYYPEDMVTDRTERFVISEIIREKCLVHMQEEIPHGIYVEVDQMKEREERPMFDIDATIYVEKASHKGMVIGSGGQMLGRIGKEARKEIETLLDAQVNLKLWVKVEKDWRKKKSAVKRFGFE